MDETETECGGGGDLKHANESVDYIDCNYDYYTVAAGVDIEKNVEGAKV